MLRTGFFIRCHRRRTDKRVATAASIVGQTQQLQMCGIVRGIGYLNCVTSQVLCDIYYGGHHLSPVIKLSDLFMYTFSIPERVMELGLFFQIIAGGAKAVSLLIRDV